MRKLPALVRKLPALVRKLPALVRKLESHAFSGCAAVAMLLIVADSARAGDLMLLIPASQSASRPFIQIHSAIPPFCHHAMQKENWGEVGV